MSDRAVTAVVSLLALIVMCGLLVAAVVWVPARIDRLDKRLDRLEDLSARVSVMHDRLGDLDKLEKKLGETTLAAAPLGRIDASVDEVVRKLNEVVVPAINEIKGGAFARADLSRITAQLTQISQTLSAAPKSDADLKKLTAQLSEIRELLEGTRKALDARTVDIGKDVKEMNLQIQKLEALINRGASPSP
jgi:Na+-transporting NADH:ubiquinone oxidoreductase subunit NqrC